MHYSPILAPVVALVAWTLIIQLWMLVSRLGEFKPVPERVVFAAH